MTNQSCETCFKNVWNGDDDPSYGCNHYWELEERYLGAMQTAFNTFGRECTHWEPLPSSEAKNPLVRLTSLSDEN